ncbi:cation diffusion facilitator CzcD-associated flavoprotein CzcO [Kibdelosporangium banguiense]|uniref:Cation diffusion facilitator CzcD-associated flavoprotein CzcO n=1 Tax=Kibdelosporangium banguiense TaxID=1365924 RepID=A0ABS4TJG2_9PSEU|nr:NAD(P)/FAD-dependent oxidoreductase [Kibdelosporangium banguiense]MBP2324464.1 cation diffusion facilitator CzcD-associated flavoprotein CzcO [Kibdelosporangium banguiense]
MRIAIVGSGFSGIGLAIRLKQAGFTDLTVFEKASDLGGVWRDNTYPGAACDAPSHLYSYSFEPNPGWSRRFAEQPEILAYLRHCAAKYDISGHIRFGVEITRAVFDAGRWILHTKDGAVHTADVLVAACGQLSRPARPDVPGLDDVFAGTVFHSADWDHGHDLRERDVAVIGNGASAIQFIPHVAAQARRLTVFQRQPHWISPKPDRRYPALRKALNRWLPWAQKVPRLGIFLWFELVLNPMLISPRGRRVLAWPIRALCRLNLRRIHDKRLRAALVPQYEVGCKRILTSNDYYQALNRPNTNLITSPINEISADAVVTVDGRRHPADTIILATGFRSHDFVAPMRVTGLNGQDLTTVWQHRPSAYLGMTVPGFPNFFLMYGPNTNVGSGSIVHMLESQMTYIVAAATLLARGGHLNPRTDVLQDFDTATQHRLATTVWNAGGCDSWYLTSDLVNTNNWPGSMTGYRRRTRRVDPTDYHLVTPVPADLRTEALDA